MKNLIKSRRGIAIEMAIGAMFIMIALSIILISISGMQTRHMKNDLNDFNEKVDLYEVTDKILFDSVSNEEEITVTSENKYKVTYTESTEKDNNEVEIKVINYTIRDETENIVLTIVTKNGKITSWGN